MNFLFQIFLDPSLYTIRITFLKRLKTFLRDSVIHAKLTVTVTVKGDGSENDGSSSKRSI